MRIRTWCRSQKMIRLFWLWSSILITSSLMLTAGGTPQHWSITISVYPTAITFPPADPDLEPVVAANSSVRVQITTSPPNRRWELLIRAEGNLVSAGGQVISISNISWTAAPQPPFRDGVLAAGQNLVLATGGRGKLTGEVFFSFQNSWSYVAGEYTQIITFTASLL